MMTPEEFLEKVTTQSVFQNKVPRLKARAKELFPLLNQPEHAQHHGRLRSLIERLVIPPTRWIVDYIGFSKVFAHKLNEKKPIDPRMLTLFDELDEPPTPEQQQRALELERIRQKGDYAAHLRNSEKYEAMEQQMINNPNRIAHWERLKKLFKIGKFRHHSHGVIRRTQYLERGATPDGFELTEESNEERWLFQALFDLYCKKYGLFGMQFDTPLVERLNITRTEFTTTISVPHWLNVARDDIRWDIVQETHGNDELPRQGVKASGNEVEKLEMYRRIDRATIEAKAAGMKGNRLRRHIEEAAKVSFTDERVHRRWQQEIRELKAKGIL